MAGYLSQGAVLAVAKDQTSGTVISQGAVLALCRDFTPSRISNGAVLMLCHEMARATRWCQCWIITRADGTVMGFTSLDVAVACNGVTCKPTPSLSASATEFQSVLGSVGNLELAGVISDSSITDEDLYGGVYDGAAVEVWQIPWDDSDGSVPKRLLAGSIGTVTQSLKESFTAEVLTPAAKLNQTAMVQTYSPGCRFDIYDDRCGLARSDYLVTGSVTAISDANAVRLSRRRIFADSSRAEADDYFNGGTLTWTSGANSGASSEIKDFAAGQFTLWEPTAFTIAAGDAYEAVPGCENTKDGCAKFSNFLNFGGFPDIPGIDEIIATPDAK